MKQSNTMNLKVRNLTVQLFWEIVGSIFIAVGIYNFAVQAEFPMTGFSGISILLYRFFQILIGLSTILLNVPVAVLCYKLLGKSFFVSSVRCMIISSVFIDYIAFLSDIGIILVGGILFQDIDGIIYGMIVNYLFAIVVDKVMYGMNAGKVALIVTTHGKAVCDAIDAACQRGTTILQARGGYKEEPRQVVMCACSTKEMYAVQRTAKETDPDAFVIIMESNEVHGEGFCMMQIGEST